MSLVCLRHTIEVWIFTYRLEQAARFSRDKKTEPDVLDTSLISLIISTALLTSLLFLFRLQIATLLGVKEHPEYITWTIWFFV